MDTLRFYEGILSWLKNYPKQHPFENHICSLNHFKTLGMFQSTYLMKQLSKKD